jgi:hypothetical protein
LPAEGNKGELKNLALEIGVSYDGQTIAASAAPTIPQTG